MSHVVSAPGASAESVHHLAVGLARALREAGVPVDLERSATFAEALALIDVVSRRQVRLAARATLLSRHEDLELFDAVFDAYFGAPPSGRGQKAPRAPRHDTSYERRTALMAYMSDKARADAPSVEVPEHTKAASAEELLARRDLAELTAEERRVLARMLQSLRLRVAERQSLRFSPSRRGARLDLARVLREAGRTGGHAHALRYRRRKSKPRPLVVLADISGSMELYSRVLLQFLHGVCHKHARTEVFVFGTRLTRITPQLRLRDVDTALDHATRTIDDFAGGTRIADNLGTFNRRHARRVLRGGAVALLISDGWETGPPEHLVEEVRRLAGRCHRLVWLNPLASGRDYAPLAAGMAAALPLVDDFLPAGNVQSLRDLADHLAAIPRRKGAACRGVPPANRLAKGPSAR